MAKSTLPTLYNLEKPCLMNATKKGIINECVVDFQIRYEN